MHEALYPIEEVCRATGLEECAVRFLEREFSVYFRFSEFSPLPNQFTIRQIALLRRISHLWQEQGQSLEAIKARIHALQAHTRRGMWTLAVTSGKGGVGKTSIAANLAVALSGRGLKTVVLDADLGMANAHVLLGIRPRRSIDAVVHGTAGIEDVMEDGPAGVRLVAGGAGMFELAEAGECQRARIAGALQSLRASADVLIIDTAAGISANVIRFLALADDVILTATPSIISLLDAYGLIKTLHGQQIATPVQLLVNMVKSQAQAREVHRKIDQCSRQFLRQAVSYLGHVKKDLNVDRAIQQRTPLICAYAHSPASICIQNIARQLVDKTVGRQPAATGDSLSDIFFREEPCRAARP